ncbi:MAG: FAD-dependent monooxygenase [Planctomycetota bacterium]|nr:FAD-dependent monooxygenase [Planctomycetota bacterium]MEC8817531.1 FAD-dependent monooxygenase [Planctomycetota bacterium]
MILDPASDWDAVVIGAGPAGSVAASLLARSGRRTLLVERATFPRTKVCGGCLAPAGVEALGNAGFAAALDSIEPRALDTLHLHARLASASYPIDRYLSIERGRMDQAFVDHAVESGARHLGGCRARVRADDSVLLESEGDARVVHPGVVVVADGLAGNSLADREDFAWRIDESSPMGAGAIVDRAPRGSHPEGITMRCGRDGYVGSSPLSDGRWVVAAALDPRSVRSLGARGAVGSVLAETGLPDADDHPTAWKAVGHLTRRRARRCAGRVLLVGDAAGYVEPLTGEGMSWGICRAAGIVPFADRIDRGEDVSEDWSRSADRMLGPRRLVCRGICGMARRPRLLAATLRVSRHLPLAGWASRRLCWSGA